MRRLRLATLWLAALACAAAGLAHAQQASEAAVKAAFIYRFANYVEWPESAFAPDAPFTIGVAGADEVAAELEKIVPGRTVNGRRVVMRRIAEGESARGLHVLFIGKGVSNPRALLRSAQSPGLLVVTEGEHGLELGSAINLVVADDRVAFEVSLDAAERNGLRISARMLAVARRVAPRS
jgi:hypothetical protein